MNKKLEEFLLNLKEENPYDYFLIMKFYYKPSSILNSSKDEINKGIYYNENASINYMLNNNFLQFLKLANLEEIIDYSSLKCLHLLLLKADEIADISINNDFSYKDICRYIKSHLKDSNIYKHKDLLDRIHKYDFYLASDVLIKIKYIFYLKDMKEKIINDLFNVDIIGNNFILNISQDGIIYEFLCDNRFLDVIENRLLNEQLSLDSIHIIIDTLKHSIIMANRREKKSLIKSFNIDKAEILINKLENKIRKEQKIIYFNMYR